jgi:hypothetical protein
MHFVVRLTFPIGNWSILVSSRPSRGNNRFYLPLHYNAYLWQVFLPTIDLRKAMSWSWFQFTFHILSSHMVFTPHVSPGVSLFNGSGWSFVVSFVNTYCTSHLMLLSSATSEEQLWAAVNSFRNRDRSRDESGEVVSSSCFSFGCLRLRFGRTPTTSVTESAPTIELDSRSIVKTNSSLSNQLNETSVVNTRWHSPSERLSSQSQTQPQSQSPSVIFQWSSFQHYNESNHSKIRQRWFRVLGFHTLPTVSRSFCSQIHFSAGFFPHLIGRCFPDDAITFTVHFSHSSSFNGNLREQWVSILTTNVPWRNKVTISFADW